MVSKLAMFNLHGIQGQHISIVCLAVIFWNGNLAHLAEGPNMFPISFPPLSNKHTLQTSYDVLQLEVELVHCRFPGFRNANIL